MADPGFDGCCTQHLNVLGAKHISNRTIIGTILKPLKHRCVLKCGGLAPVSMRQQSRTRACDRVIGAWC